MTKIIQVDNKYRRLEVLQKPADSILPLSMIRTLGITKYKLINLKANYDIYFSRFLSLEHKTIYSLGSTLHKLCFHLTNTISKRI